MTLEEPDTLDIAREKEGKFYLGIIDAGITKDPEERFKKLFTKLKAYTSFLTSDYFKEQYPQYLKQKEFEIFVMCEDAPTEKMQQLSSRLQNTKTGTTNLQIVLTFLRI